jgi:hypothetical protein
MISLRKKGEHSMIDHKETDCPRWRELLAVLPPDELSPSAQRDLDAHLRSCPACTSVRDQYRLLSTSLQDFSSDALPPGLPPRLLQLWQEQSAQGEANQSKTQSVRIRWRSHIKASPVRTIFMGIAAVSLVAVLFFVPFLTPHPARSTRSGSGILSSASGKASSPPSVSGNTDLMPYLGPISVTFAPSISYEQALRIVTNLGLQPSLECGIVQLTPNVLPSPQWQPVGQKDAFLKNHRLLVQLTAFTPDDVSLRLQATPGVKIGPHELDTCSAVVYGTPLPGTALPGAAAAYVHVTFAHSVSYDTALYTISNLGLALADLCYEHEKFDLYRTPTWHPMSQEKSFIHTRTLIVETTHVTSSLWQQQLHASPGVNTITSSSSLTC